MSYTKALESDNTRWSLSEFTALHGRFSIIQEVSTGRLCGRFNNRGDWTEVHIEKKIRGIAISHILNNQDDYEIIASLGEYILYKKGDIIDYATVEQDLNPNEQNAQYFDVHEYYRENPDIIEGEVIW